MPLEVRRGRARVPRRVCGGRTGLIVPLLVVGFFLASATPAAADRSFTTRFTTNDTGNITFAANTLMVCPASATGCTAARNTVPIATGTNNALNNNGYLMQYVNTAPGAVAGSPAFDSSSATLSLPPTATVLFAGLYWGADTSSGQNPTGVAAPNPGLRGQVGFRVPGSSAYATVSASTVDQSTGAATRYSAFADVTSQVLAAGAGTYSVANVQAGTGGDRYAGWTLVVAYQDPTQPPRNLTVDDGLVTVSSGSPPITFPIGGFKTPPSGPVNTTLGFVGYEGDTGLTGDSASLNGKALSDGTDPVNNFFSSGISNLGMNVTTRNPNDINNFAFDANLIGANGILPNNATTANVVLTTSGDTYFPAVVTLATDLYAPNITSSKSVTNLTHPSGLDRPGDTLRYTVSYKNTGSDSAANFVMRDPIPVGTNYTPGSLRITAGPQAPARPTDALGDDAAEFNSSTGEVIFRLGAGGSATTGGVIAPSETDTVTFEVTIDAGDAPGQQIVNQATATFTGLTLGTPFTDTSPRVTNIVSAPALSLSKSHTGSLIAGQSTTFALAVANVGNVGTDGSVVTVTDLFPSRSFSAIANAGGDGWNCDIADLRLTCTRSDTLGAGDSYPPIFVDGRVQDPAPVTVVNVATVSGGGSSPDTASDGGGAGGLADVSITKSADARIVANGGTVTYTLGVQNTGPSTAQDVVVSDALDPASFADVSAQSTQGSCDATVSCSLGALAAGGTATITITATVRARDTTLANTARVSSSTPDPDDSNNTDSTTVIVPATADLSIAKTGSPNPDQGTTTSYTLTVSNDGPDTAHGVAINDVLPSQFTATGASGAGFSCVLPSGPGGTVTCTSDAFAPTGGSPVQITITGTVAAGTAGQSQADSVTISSNSDDPDLSNNTAAFDQVIGPAADLSITKTALVSAGGPEVTNRLSVGDTFVYSLDVTNNGPGPASSVQATDTLPTGITLVSATPGQGNCSATGQTVVCGLNTISAGQSVLITLVVTVGPAGANSVIENTASVSSPTPDPNPSGPTPASSTVGVGAVANLALSKSVSPQAAAVGDTLTYRLTATNDIPSVEGSNPPSGLGTTGGVITDTLPPGLQFVSSSSCTAAGATVTCQLGPIAKGDVITASYTARVTAAAAGTSVTNQATISSEAAGGFGALQDLDPLDNTDSATLRVNPEADLSLSKTASTSNPGVDGEVDYTLTAHNAGPNDATGVVIEDPLPAGLSFIAASVGCDNIEGTVTCPVGTISSAGTASVTIKAHTTPAIAGMSVANIASVSANEHDPNSANNQANTTIKVQPLVDLSLKKVASTPAPAAGGPVSYTLTLTNNGPSPATGVTVTDPLPSGLRFSSVSSSQGSCHTTGQVVSCRLGTVADRGTAIVTITATVGASTAGKTLHNTARASADEPIAQPELTRSEASITLVAKPPKPRAKLELTKTVNHRRARFGATLKYTITVTNAGPAVAMAPTVVDAFSAAASIVSAHPSSGTCHHLQPVRCKLASIAPRHRATITLLARGLALGRLRNTATVTTPTPLAPESRTQATATTTITPGSHSRIELRDTTNTPKIPSGGTATFTMTATNPNPWPVHDVKICGQVPRGMILIAGSVRLKRTGRSVCWRVGTLRPHHSTSDFIRLEAGPREIGRVRQPATVTGTAGGRKLNAHARAQVNVAPPSPCGSAPDPSALAHRGRPVAVMAC